MIWAAIVVVCFAIAIASVWLTKPGGRVWKWNDTGYGDKPPGKQEWRQTQIRYTELLVFLGVVFAVVTFISTT